MTLLLKLAPTQSHGCPTQPKKKRKKRKKTLFPIEEEQGNFAL